MRRCQAPQRAPSPSVASPRAADGADGLVPQVERGVNSAPKGQKTHKAGGRPGVLKRPQPPVAVVLAAFPRTAGPSLATPCLADAVADVVLLLPPVPHGCCVGGQKEGGGEGEEGGGAQRRCRRRGRCKRRKLWSALLLLERNKRKRKKRRKKKLPRTSSPRSSRLARQRVRVRASVFVAALLRAAWFNSGNMYLLRC